MYGFKAISLDEAAHVLREAGVNIDDDELYNAKFPRPKTLHCKRIRIKDKSTGAICILAQTDSRKFQVIDPDHNRYRSPTALKSSMINIDLNELESVILARDSLVLLDTWSPKSEFPELVEC